MFRGTLDQAKQFVKENEGYYVYILRRPDHRPFYVGKGKWPRVFQHEVEARHPGNHPKLNVIRAIWRKGETVVYEIDSFHEEEQAAYERECVLIESIKRLHEGGPLTNLAPGGGSSAGLSPVSKEKHRVSLSGIPADDPEKATLNRYLLSIGDVRSICIKVADRFKHRPTIPHPSPRSPTPRQAYALVASAAANSVFLEPECVIPRKLVVEGVEGLIENGVCCDIAKSGIARLMPAGDPREEAFVLDETNVQTLMGFVDPQKLVDLGIWAE